MDFDLPKGVEELRAEVRRFLQAEWSKDKQLRAEAGEAYEEERALRKKLGERGWLAASWPVEYGGGGRSFWETIAIAEEFQYAGVHTSSTAVRVVGPTILLVGSEAQKRRFLPAIAKGEIDFALGYTEPDAGSDLASLKTRAEKDGDSFVINGTKIFTSLAHRAEYCWLAARTDPDAPKHRGISLFIVDLSSPGITVRPLWTMSGRRTNVTYWENVRVPADALVGELDRGWYYMTSALDLERLAYYTPGKLMAVADELIQHVRDGAPEAVSANPYVRASLVRIAVDVMVARLLYWRAASMIDAGTIPNHEAAMSKMFMTELLQRIAQEGTRMFGPYGQLTPGDPDAPLDGHLEHEHRAAVMETFGGGSSELMRNIIATRGMGLPRA
jgi:alkylation response protein AidB-like acyl-CoA dehydrogenase